VGQRADRRDVWNIRLAHDGVHDVVANGAGALSTRLQLQSNDRFLLAGTLYDASARAGRVFWKAQDRYKCPRLASPVVLQMIQAFLGRPLLGSTVWFVFRFSRFD
jgi:hypothetical protein